MANLTTYCRITGHSRNLPKPCYFPLLPPISPASAKKVCRITRHAGAHNYSPIIAFAKPIKFDSGVSACSITKFTGFGYFRPKPVQDSDDDKWYQRLLNSMKNRPHREVSPDTQFSYEIPNLKKVVVLPGEIEEAIRIGEIESLGLSEDNDHISIKVKDGKQIKIEMEEVKPEVLAKEKISQGKGPNEEVIEQQIKVVEERNKRKQDTMAKRKLFEDKDKKAEEEEIKSKERPEPKKPKVIPPVIQEDSESSEEDVPCEKMSNDVKVAEKCAIKVEAYESEISEDEIDLDSYSDEDPIEPIKISKPMKKPAPIAPTVNVKQLDVVAPPEPVKPAPKVAKEIVKVVANLPKEVLKTTQNTTKIISEMVPKVSEIKTVVQCPKEEITYGYAVKVETGTKFISYDFDDDMPEECVPGVMMPVEEEVKFVPGQIVKLAEEQSFVAGQSLETSEGLKFVPGLTVKNDTGEIQFIPGTTVSDQAEKPSFVCGRIVEANETEFVQGQYLDVGKENEVFTPGQTIEIDDGLKFVPGEIISPDDGKDKFVPGINLGKKEKEKFVPGQVFKSDEGLKFTPGQIFETIEGPSFVPGRSIKSSDGSNIFIKGKPIINEFGEVRYDNPVAKAVDDVKEIEELDHNHIIPNKKLYPMADANGEVIGFNVKPVNTIDLLSGERLYGSIVETEFSVLFYMDGKLPDNLDPNAKIISGELRVSDSSQRFIPGKLLKSTEGEKFVPGQVVVTNNREEFVPGKIIESIDGPKFIPGQVISTVEGDKFVPGQVLTDSKGSRFVPGQIIQTYCGSTFIPGQMMNTDEGRKFVPGQLIDTNEGPRFVPGQVLESKEGPKFLPGQIVETEDGLRYVPSEADDEEDNMEFTFQGFDITAEELLLLSTAIDDSDRKLPVTSDQGLIDSATLRKLSCDNIVVIGRTSEPSKMKKKKSKKSNVAFTSSNDMDTKDEFNDLNTEKVTILKGLIASQATVSNHKRSKELRKVSNILDEKDIDQNEPTEATAISYMISSEGSDLDIITDFIGNDSQLVREVISSIGDTASIEVNSQAQKLMKNVMRSIVTKRCNDEVENIIEQLISNPDTLFTDHNIQMLLAEAVGVVCITGDIEAASLLEQFISEPNDPYCLKEDKDVLAVIRQLLVLHEIAKRNSKVENILHELRKDPANLKNKNEIFRLISQVKLLLRNDSAPKKSFNIRHIASSKDIPTEIFEQLKESNMEAEKFIASLPDEMFYGILDDDRCGEKLLDSLNPCNMKRTLREIEKFKKGMAIVVAKENMQAVIPRSHARSVYYGIMPYLLIDEEGIKFFERGLTGRKLAPSKVIENTWCDDEDYPSSESHHSQCMPDVGQQYSVMLPGMGFNYGTPTGLQYTSLISSQGPTQLTYNVASRRSSRDDPITSYRLRSRSTTPSRRSSTSSLYGSAPLPTSEVFPRRGSAITPVTVVPTLSTISNYDDIEEADDVNYCTSLIPYQEDSDDEPSSIRRSDTVANLLEKYSNFSVEREFAKPITSSKKSKSVNRRRKNNKYADDEEEDVTIFPIGSNRRRSLATPEKEQTHSSNGTSDSGDYISQRENRRLRRPISDIYEVDEIESPVRDSIASKGFRSHLPPKKNRAKRYNRENSEEEIIVDRYSLPILSYNPRTRTNRKSSAGDIEQAKYSRRLSEPHITRKDSGSGLYSGSHGFRNYNPSRSQDRDSLYSREQNNENGDLPYGTTMKNDHRRRYRHIDDPEPAGYEYAYDPSKPYNSRYLDSHELSDDDEERPSYQLLGRNVRGPSTMKSYAWQPSNQYGSMAPRPYEAGLVFNRNQVGNHSFPGRYDQPQMLISRNPLSGNSLGGVREPSVPYNAYENNVLPNLNYGYEAAPYLAVPNYVSRGNSPYSERSSALLDSYSDPQVRSALSKGKKASTRDKHRSKKQENGRRYTAPITSTNSKYASKESLNADSDDDVRLKLPKFKKFDASKYLNDHDDSDNDNNDYTPTAYLSRSGSPVSDYDGGVEQRQLATDISKKYLRNFSLDDKDEPEDEEEEIS